MSPVSLFQPSRIKWEAGLIAGGLEELRKKRSPGAPHSPSWHDLTCPSVSQAAGLAHEGAGNTGTCTAGWQPWHRKCPEWQLQSVTFHRGINRRERLSGELLALLFSQVPVLWVRRKWLFACCTLQAAASRGLSLRVRPCSYASEKSRVIWGRQGSLSWKWT